MTISNVPTFSEWTHANEVRESGKAKAETVEYTTLSEDERDRLILIAAEANYRDRDWTEFAAL